MDLNSLNATKMRNAVLHSLAAVRSIRSGDVTGAFLDELHRRGCMVVPMLEAEFEEIAIQQEPRT